MPKKLTGRLEDDLTNREIELLLFLCKGIIPILEKEFEPRYKKANIDFKGNVLKIHSGILYKHVLYKPCRIHKKIPQDYLDAILRRLTTPERGALLDFDIDYPHKKREETIESKAIRGKFWYVKNDFKTICKLSKIFFYRTNYDEFLNSAFIKKNWKKIQKAMNTMNKKAFNQKSKPFNEYKDYVHPFIKMCMFRLKTDPLFRMGLGLACLKEEGKKKRQGLKTSEK